MLPRKHYSITTGVKARQDAEARLQSEREAKELEASKLKELQEAQKEMEVLLEEERQAKRDEEIVRNLQARCSD